MTSPLFKRAYVRGLNAELSRQGAVSYPTKEAADYVADYVADNSGMSDPVDEPEQLTKQASIELCNALVSASNELHAQVTFSDAFAKTAAASDPVTTANTDAWDIMEKCASETGSLVQGGDKPNDQPDAAANNAEAALEAQRRPENYANLGERGVGNLERKGQGNVGSEETHPESPRATDSESNSVTQYSKAANFGMGGGGGLPEGGGMPEGDGPHEEGGMPEEGVEGSEEGVSPDVIKGLELGLRLAAEDPEGAAQLLAAHDQEQEQAVASSGQIPEDHGDAGPAGMPPSAPPMEMGPPKQASDRSFLSIIQKIANSTGSLINGGESPNTLAAAAANNAEAALENKQRPEGYAHMGENNVGKSVMNPTAAQRIGTEQPHPLAPGATDHTPNSITAFGKSAFDQVFEQTANQIVPYLPAKMPDVQKLAHLRAVMGLNTNEQGQYLQELYTSLGAEKTAAANLAQKYIKTAGAKPEVRATTKQASTKSLSNLKLALARLQQAP
jgi:hypothetical protein